MITRVIAVIRIETDVHIRCERCYRGLAQQATRPWRIMCPRCKHVNLSRHLDKPTVIQPTPVEQKKDRKPVVKRKRRHKPLDSRPRPN